MKTVFIKPSEAKQGDIIKFWGYTFKLGAITKHEPSAHKLEHGQDHEKLPVYTSFGECIDQDEQIKNDCYFNSYIDGEGNQLPTGWMFQNNDNTTWEKVIGYLS